MNPTPGQVYWAYRDKRRPVIVVSRNSLNSGNRIVVVPLTSARLEERRSLRNCVLLDPRRHGLPKACVAQTELIATIDMRDLIVNEGPITTIDGETLRRLVRAIGYMMDAECEPA
jgi:mRNA-degrading endonuclease toxin of MazEF toxin-antitoxin module